MKPLFETESLIVSHDPFRADLIADCKYGVARLPWNARTKLATIKTDSLASFAASVELLGGKISKPCRYCGSTSHPVGCCAQDGHG